MQLAISEEDANISPSLIGLFYNRSVKYVFIFLLDEPFTKMSHYVINNLQPDHLIHFNGGSISLANLRES